MKDFNYLLFYRAGLLLHLERYQEALTELEELRQIAPKESLVYYLLSKVSLINLKRKKDIKI
jgi:tetratricopeptide (TPR) repeat protein